MNNPTSIRVTSASESARYAQEIRGRLQEDKVVIAVEGDDDLRIDRKLFKKNVVIVPTQGKLRLVNIDKELFDSYHKNLIAIKDADFDHLNGVVAPHNQIFLTDKHDMEMTMIDCDIIESILSEYLSKADNFESLCDGQKIISDLSANLTEYSYIKWMNENERCSINFDVVTMKGLGAADGKVTISSALEQLYSSEANSRDDVKKIKEDDVADFIGQHPCANLDLLICGHDFCAALLEWMRNNGSKINLSRSGLESLIRLQYSRKKFHATTLYHNIHEWELRCDRQIVA